MTILRSSPASPYGRKIKLAAAILGLSDAIKIVVTDTSDPNDPLRGDNPLGKIPVLVPDGGTPIYDSRVILEYLDVIAGGGRIIPTEPSARIAALTLQALADGICDASILRMYEIRYRVESERSATWVTMQTGKVDRSLSWLEANPPSADGILTVGEIAVACALGYLDLRFQGAWRESHPKLVTFLEAFAARVPAFAATRVTP
jgi:glutathione S-transferase